MGTVLTAITIAGQAHGWHSKQEVYFAAKALNTCMSHLYGQKHFGKDTGLEETQNPLHISFVASFRQNKYKHKY